MTIEQTIIKLQEHMLKLAELVERMAESQRRTLEVIDKLVTKLEPTTRNENATIQKEM